MFPRSPRQRLTIGAALLLLPFAAACDDDDDDDDGSFTPQESGFSALLDEAQQLPPAAAGARVRVTVTNLAPETGTFQSPVWLAFHDGTFELLDAGSAADTYFPVDGALERAAEDGDLDPLADAFAASAAGGVQDVRLGQLGEDPGPLAPGETIRAVFELDPLDPRTRYMSFVSAVLPSNDAFVANDDPLAHEIFDAGGVFVATDFVVTGGDVLDAGTEVNDEDPASTNFFGQGSPDSGMDENGVVTAHAGYLAAGMGGILDDQEFAEADFTAPGYEMLSFRFEELPAADDALGVAALELIDGGDALRFTIAASGLSGRVTGAHVHSGAAGTTGPVVLDLEGSIVEDADGSVRIEGEQATDADLLMALAAGELYVDVHTALNPDGELRGQVTGDATTTYLGTLDADQELPPPVTGTAVRVVLRNRAPAMGTWQTPVWLGFHDGTFDTNDVGTTALSLFPVTNALEHQAEDGDPDPMTEAFEAMQPGGVQGVVRGQFQKEIRPGEVLSTVFRLDPDDAATRYMSYSSMVIPSNDAFVSDGDPLAHPVFDGSGDFLGASFSVPGTAVLDAGTEVNDEIPASTAFFGQTVDGTGTTEGGLVAAHPGFLAAGMGGILDDAMFAQADFTAPGYETLGVELRELAAPAPAAGVVTLVQGPGTSEVTFAVSAHGLSGPATAMHFHQAAAGATGPVVVTLTDSITRNEDGELFASDTVAVDSDFLGALEAGQIYLNIHTALNPDGELRGQVEAVE